VLICAIGYSAESEHTYFTAPPLTDAKLAFAAMMKSRRRAITMIRHGVPCSEIDMTISDFLRDERYAGEDQRLHRIGYGIGLGTHERHWLAEERVERLSSNMAISIDPGIYLKGIGGFRQAETVLVTDAGCKLLTSSPIDTKTLVTTSRK